MKDPIPTILYIYVALFRSEATERFCAQAIANNEHHYGNNRRKKVVNKL
jgi:hypothetical protein